MKRSKGIDSRSTGIHFRNSLIFGFFLFTGACHHPVKEVYPNGKSFGKVIYDTFIINRDSTDFWGAECLADFNRNALIDQIFDDVYKGRIIPTDYFTNEKISLAQLKKMETDGEFSRKNISKIRFEEQWLWDMEKSEMQKQIISMTIAYEVYDFSGNSRGQKPILKLVFRKN